LEDRVIIFDDFLMQLEGSHIDYIDICLRSSKDSRDLVVLLLLQIFHCDSLEFLKRIGTYMDLEPI
jgi:hypothetical protein